MIRIYLYDGTTHLTKSMDFTPTYTILFIEDGQHKFIYKTDLNYIETENPQK